MLQDTIIVTANYRLGVFGYLAGAALKADSADGSVGTYGFQDQRAALQFLQDTGAAFGGDVTRVTIFGESAGAASVSAHLVSPRSKGLFSRAIIESGTFSVWTAQSYNISGTRLAQFARNVGCGPADLACMRALNATQVLDADRGLTSAFLEWSPTIDGVEVIDDPRALLAAGKVADVPVMLGFNADEGTLFTRAPKDLNASDYVSAILAMLPTLPPASAAAVAAQYPCSDFSPALGQSACWWAITRFIRDAMFACPVQSAAALLTGLPGRANGAATFAYAYEQVLFLVDIVDLFKPYRCFHGSELPLVFNLWPTLMGFGEARLGDYMSGAWTAFAATGNPNVPGAPVWAPFGAAASTVRITTSAAGVALNNTPGLLAAQCAFWKANPIPVRVAPPRPLPPALHAFPSPSSLSTPLPPHTHKSHAPTHLSTPCCRAA